MADGKERRGPAAKRGASPAGEVRGLASMEEVRFVLEQLPGAEFRRKFNGVSFFVGAKVFAFLNRDGVVMKLPMGRVEALLEERESRRLTMEKRVMREWIVVVFPPGALGSEVELLREAMRFVAGITN